MKERGGAGHYIGLRAVSQRMDALQVFLDSRRVGLFVGPSFQHGRPHSGRTNGIYTDAQRRIIERHGLGQGNQRPLGGDVGGMIDLAD